MMKAPPPEIPLERRRTLEPGSRLGPYEIVRLIGAGGMGRVYLARDERLERDVALKVLPEDLSRDAVALKRFKREARVVAALSHPNILALYDVGREGDVDFAVTELLQGETLRSRLLPGPLPWRKAVEIGVGIAEGLAAAHARGIIHRDLKPANIFLTTDGHVKILDFGLARRAPLASLAGDACSLPTASFATEPGLVMGTVGYMSPEQLRTEPVDQGTDMFSFGCVLHEMLSGRSPFARATPADAIAAILDDDPVALPPLSGSVPPTLEQVVQRCLAKDPRQRLRSAHDLALALRALPGTAAALPAPVARPVRQSPAERTRPPARSALDGGARSELGRRAAAAPQAGRRERLLVGVAAVILAIAALYSARHSREKGDQRLTARFEVTLPPELVLDSTDSPAVSPDGRRVVFAAVSGGRRQLWIRSLDRRAIEPLHATEGAVDPFWSPESRSIAFFAAGKLKRVDAVGGPSLALADAPEPDGGSWGRAGSIVFASRGVIYRIAETGGAPEPVTVLAGGDARHSQPRFLPDGRRFLYLVDGRQRGVYAASIDAKEQKRLLDDWTRVAISPDGHILFVREYNLMAQRFDLGTLEERGRPFPVADRVKRESFSVSDNGVLVLRPADPTVAQLAWFGRDGGRLAAVGAPGPYEQLSLSPSGRSVAIQRQDAESANIDIWLLELATGVLSRLTLDPRAEVDPAWSPDERSIVFSAFRSGKFTPFLKDLATGKEERLVDFAEDAVIDDWSPDGRFVIFRTFGRAVYAVPMTGERKVRMLADTPYLVDQSHVSPDGRWIAFNAGETGRWEVYVATLPEFTGKHQISNGGGVQPMWRRDGKELFYLTPGGRMMSVQVGTSRLPAFGAPRVLFETRIQADSALQQYAVSADGQRFLVLEQDARRAQTLNITLQWLAERQKD
jgi:Tol biopolymer transport system component